MKNRASLLLTTATCLPLLGLLLILLSSAFFTLVGVEVPELLIIPIIWAFYCMVGWPKISLLCLIFISLSLVPTWAQRDKHRCQLTLTAAYTATVVVYLAYATWAVITKPIMEF